MIGGGAVPTFSAEDCRRSIDGEDATNALVGVSVAANAATTDSETKFFIFQVFPSLLFVFYS